MSQQYATIADLKTIGINPVAFQNVADDILNANLLAASEECDNYMQARYRVLDSPLASWGSDLKRLVCKIAAYTLMGVRGYNPGAGADVTLRMGYEDAINTLKGVARQSVHLNVVPSFTQGSVQQLPQVRSREPRGW